MRSISEAFCSCGGKPVEVDTTEQEDKEHGCKRKGCCVRAWRCPKCETRWTFALEAPEPDWD